MSIDYSKLCADYLRHSIISPDFKLKASHSREIVAAMFGYKSHAALLHEADHPLLLLAESPIFIPDTELMDTRLKDLSCLPYNEHLVLGWVKSLVGFLREQKLITGEAWVDKNLVNYVLEQLLHYNGDVTNQLSGIMAETNTEFDHEQYDSATVSNDGDSIVIEATGEMTGISSPDAPFCGNTIDCTVTVFLERHAGRCGFYQPVISADGSVRNDWLEPDPNPPSSAALSGDIEIAPGQEFDYTTADMNPYRKLLVIGLNEILRQNIFSLDWDGASKLESGHLEMMIAGHRSKVLWQDAGFGEVAVAVWWKYDHDKHPQANLEGNAREAFTTPSPLANKRSFPKFVGAVASAWLERDKGKYLQGKGSGHIFERYMRKGEKALLQNMPNPVPQSFDPEGPFEM